MQTVCGSLACVEGPYHSISFTPWSAHAIVVPRLEGLGGGEGSLSSVNPSAYDRQTCTTQPPISAGLAKETMPRSLLTLTGVLLHRTNQRQRLAVQRDSGGAVHHRWVLRASTAVAESVDHPVGWLPWLLLVLPRLVDVSSRSSVPECSGGTHAWIRQTELVA